MEAARARQTALTKPPGSLGRLEQLAIWLAGVQDLAVPHSLQHRAVIVLAGDHGVTAQGVSAYPSAVSGQMVRNFAAGGAAINALARVTSARVVVADLGVAADLTGVPGLLHSAVAPGTADMSQGPAMSLAQARQAVEAGITIINDEIDRGLHVVCTGEMGIGNTTAAAAITAAITGAMPREVTGRGTGVTDDVLLHKIQIVEQALQVNMPRPRTVSMSFPALAVSRSVVLLVLSWALPRAMCPWSLMAISRVRQP